MKEALGTLLVRGLSRGEGGVNEGGGGVARLTKTRDV